MIVLFPRWDIVSSLDGRWICSFFWGVVFILLVVGGVLLVWSSLRIFHPEIRGFCDGSLEGAESACFGLAEDLVVLKDTFLNLQDRYQRCLLWEKLTTRTMFSYETSMQFFPKCFVCRPEEKMVGSKSPELRIVGFWADESLDQIATGYLGTSPVSWGFGLGDWPIPNPPVIPGPWGSMCHSGLLVSDRSSTTSDWM